jgi:hypothetical protein
MTRAARSVHVFGIYLLGTGAVLVGAPNTLLAILRLPPTSEPWIHVLGITVMAIGMYYMTGARAEQRAFLRATVWVRAFVFASLIVLAILNIAPPVLVGFGVVDAAGALWTRLSLREAAAGGTG